MGTVVVELTKKQKTLLKEIEKATASATGYMMADRLEAQPLFDAGQIDMEETITNGNQIAVRIKGAPDSAALDAAGQETGDETVELVTVAEGKQYPFYAPLADIPMEESKRGGPKQERYPFSKMSKGDSFLVPVSDLYPEPWKTFASTVSGANRRFKKLNVETKFTLRRVTKGDKYPNGYAEPDSGARVFRTV